MVLNLTHHLLFRILKMEGSIRPPLLFRFLFLPHMWEVTEQVKDVRLVDYFQFIFVSEFFAYIHWQYCSMTSSVSVIKQHEQSECWYDALTKETNLIDFIFLYISYIIYLTTDIAWCELRSNAIHIISRCTLIVFC